MAMLWIILLVLHVWVLLQTLGWMFWFLLSILYTYPGSVLCTSGYIFLMLHCYKMLLSEDEWSWINQHTHLKAGAIPQSATVSYI
jgi:hypothetical protein